MVAKILKIDKKDINNDMVFPKILFNKDVIKSDKVGLVNLRGRFNCPNACKSDGLKVG